MGSNKKDEIKKEMTKDETINNLGYISNLMRKKVGIYKQEQHLLNAMIYLQNEGNKKLDRIIELLADEKADEAKKEEPKAKKEESPKKATKKK